MKEPRRDIHITITDLNNDDEVIISVLQVLNQIIRYYAINDKRKLEEFVLDISVYIGSILLHMGYPDKGNSNGTVN